MTWPGALIPTGSVRPRSVTLYSGSASARDPDRTSTATAAAQKRNAASIRTIMWPTFTGGTPRVEVYPMRAPWKDHGEGSEPWQHIRGTRPPIARVGVPGGTGPGVVTAPMV